MKQAVKRIVNDNFDKLMISLSRKNEIKKYEHPRLKQVWERIELTKIQEREIDDLYMTYYGEKIPYTWHRYYTAFTNTFDAAYFPELLYIPEFEHFMNLENDYNHVLADKSLIRTLTKAVGINSPKTFIESSCGILRDENYCEIDLTDAVGILSDIGKVFIKPTVDSNSGRGCRIANFEKGKDILSGETVDDIINSIGLNFTIQQCLQCHNSLRNIYSGSVNTFRVITYRWQGQIYHMPATLRMGRCGRYLDNVHSDGIFVSVDDSGTLGDMAFSEMCEKFVSHPDTQVEFKNYKIPNFMKVIQASKRMCAQVPWLGCVNWDFTIDETGEPVLIEINTRGGSIQLSERTSKLGPFGDRTPEILRWIRFMKSLSVSERKNYRYGQMQ